MTMHATHIRLKTGTCTVSSCIDIEAIFIEGAEPEVAYLTENVHDFLIHYPGSITLGVFPWKELLPVVGANGEKYIRTEKDDSPNDALLSLPLLE